MRKTEMKWRENIIKGYEINDIIIDIKNIYTNMRPYLIIIDYITQKKITQIIEYKKYSQTTNINYKIKKTPQNHKNNFGSITNIYRSMLTNFQIIPYFLS